jgi:hypothetical protein
MEMNSKEKNNQPAGHQWLMPIILPTHDTEIRRRMVQGLVEWLKV